MVWLNRSREDRIFSLQPVIAAPDLTVSFRVLSLKRCGHSARKHRWMLPSQILPQQKLLHLVAKKLREPKPKVDLAEKWSFHLAGRALFIYTTIDCGIIGANVTHIYYLFTPLSAASLQSFLLDSLGRLLTLCPLALLGLLLRGIRSSRMAARLIGFWGRLDRGGNCQILIGCKPLTSTGDGFARSILLRYLLRRCPITCLCV